MVVKKSSKIETAQGVSRIPLKNFIGIILIASVVGIISFLITWGLTTQQDSSGINAAVGYFTISLFIGIAITIFLVGVAVWGLGHSINRVNQTMRRPYIFLSLIPLLSIAIMWAIPIYSYSAEKLDPDYRRFQETTVCRDLRRADESLDAFGKEMVNDYCDDAQLTVQELQELEQLYRTIQP